ncbi:MAG: dehydratase [Dehalococcoidia bacterium]|nr:dehydratase [Dehalococcoidia bacterium]
MGQQVYFEEVTAGLELAPLRKHPSRRQLVMWAGASGDFYEIHYDTEFARQNKLDDVIVHGRLKASFLGQLLTEWAGTEGWLKKMSCRFKGTDPTNEDMLVRATVTGTHEDGLEHLVELDIWTERQDGTRTTLGSATVVLPSRKP